MKLIVDSGATKSAWVLLENNAVIDTQYLKGVNATSNPDSISYISDLQLPKNGKIESVYFYGAGVSSPIAIKHLFEALSKHIDCSEIQLHHDILGAARAVSSNQEGIVSILGTGTNTVVFNGKKVTQSFKAMGYLFADYGSGYHIGKEILRRYYSEQMSESDKVLFEEVYITNQDDLLFRIYSADKPNFVTAALSKFLAISSPELKESILAEVFAVFFEKQILLIDNYKEYKLSFVGSIADVFQTQLRTVAGKHGLEIDKIMAKPIDGLIKFHMEN